MKAILDIPDASLLALFNLEDLVQIFCLTSGVEQPDIICLPAYDQGGAQFESRVTSREDSMWPRYSLEKEVQKIRKRYPKTQVYLSVAPVLPGIKASHLTCRNQFGEDRQGVCFVNPHVQEVILNLVLESINKFSPEGIIFDIVDIHGQNSRGKGKPVNITCFCNHCKEQMLDLKFDSNIFSQRISPLNLVLQATDTGIRFITPKAHYSAEQIVDIAIKEEYISQDDDQTRSWAQIILNYIRVRSKVTGIALGEICRGIKAVFPDKRVGAILNIASFDWTGGTDLNGLAGQVDEVWLDIEDLNAATVPPNMDIFAYGSDRSRYRIDALFEFASDRRFLETRARKLPIDETLELLRSRAGDLGTVQNLSKTFVSSLQRMDYISGFVGIPYDKKLFQQIIQAVREELLVMAGDTQSKSSSTLKDIIKEYIALLVQYREQGHELNRREIVGLAAQLNLID